MTIKEAELSFKKGFVGKTVFFMNNNQVVKATIANFDDFQFFTPKRYAIQNDQPFFFSLEDLLKHLEATMDASDLEK